MADEDYEGREGGAVGEDEEEWVDPVDVEELLPGPTTLFVGGFSKYKTINDALEAVRTTNDRIVVLDSLDGDVIVDTTKFAGVSIVGVANRANTFSVKPFKGEGEEDDAEGEDEAGMADEGDDDINVEGEEEGAGDFTAVERRKAKAMKHTLSLDPVAPLRRGVYRDTTHIRGQLILKHSEPLPSGAGLPTGFPVVDEDEEEEARAAAGGGGEEDADGEGGDETGSNGDASNRKAKAAKLPPRVSFHALTFTGGLDAEAGTTGLISGCQLGEDTPPIASSSPPSATVRIGGLSTVEIAQTLVLSSASKAAVYCFPHSRCLLTDVDIVGVRRKTEGELKAEKEEEERKKPRGYIAPPPPAPSVPLSVYCSVGVFAEESLARLQNVCIRNTGIGIYSIGACEDITKAGRKFTVEGSNIRQAMTVGILLDRASNAVLKGCVVSLCGREALVCGDGHPTVRDCLLIGDTRFKKACVTTGVTDNTICTKSFQVITEDPLFALKGFKQIPEDPTAPRVRKVAAATRVA